MKSVKQIAEMLGVSKTTVQRAIKELDIKPFQYKNKHVFEDVETAKIINFINPIPIQTDSEKTKIDDAEGNYSSFFGTKKSDNAPTDSDNATERNAAAASDSQLVDILLQQLEVKDKTIESLLEQNKMLSQTNAFLSKTIEDKNRIAIEQQENNNDINGMAAVDKSTDVNIKKLNFFQKIFKKNQ